METNGVLGGQMRLCMAIQDNVCHIIIYRTIRGHSGPYGAIQGHTELYKTKQGHEGPYGTIWGHTGPYMAVHGHTRPYGAKSGHMVLYGAIWGHTGPYRTIWDQILLILTRSSKLISKTGNGII